MITPGIITGAVYDEIQKQIPNVERWRIRAESSNGPGLFKREPSVLITICVQDGEWHYVSAHFVKSEYENLDDYAFEQVIQGRVRAMIEEIKILMKKHADYLEAVAPKARTYQLSDVVPNLDHE